MLTLFCIATPKIFYSLPAISHIDNPSFFDESPVFMISTQLEESKVTIKPTIEQIQETITQVGRAIVASAKGIGQWQSYPLEGLYEHHQHAAQGSWHEKKERRRALYRSIAEDRAGPPYKPYNFYAQVCENKDVVKFTSSLNNCTHTFKESYKEFMRVWQSFDFLWNPDRYVVAKEFAATNPSWVQFEEKLNECHEGEELLNNLLDHYDFGAIRIISSIFYREKRWFFLGRHSP